MSQLPRPAADPNRLQQLRQAAFARLLAEEETVAAPAPRVTRRWALGRFALAAVAVTPVVSSAMAVVSPRSAAPQYGAPGLYGNPSLPRPIRIATRDDLASLSAWHTSSTVLITPGKKDGYIWGFSKQTHSIAYMLPSGDTVNLSVLSDPTTRRTWIVPAEDAFFAVEGSELYGFKWDGGDLIMTPSLFSIPTPEDDAETAAIQQFARQMDDRAIQRAVDPSRGIHIAVPGSKARGNAIMSATVKDHVLELGTYSGNFSINLKTRKAQ